MNDSVFSSQVVSRHSSSFECMALLASVCRWMFVFNCLCLFVSVNCWFDLTWVVSWIVSGVAGGLINVTKHMPTTITTTNIKAIGTAKPFVEFLPFIHCLASQSTQQGIVFITEFHEWLVAAAVLQMLTTCYFMLLYVCVHLSICFSVNIVYRYTYICVSVCVWMCISHKIPFKIYICCYCNAAYIVFGFVWLLILFLLHKKQTTTTRTKKNKK